MRLKSGLDPVLGSQAKIRLLRTLVAFPERAWTVGSLPRPLESRRPKRRGI